MAPVEKSAKAALSSSPSSEMKDVIGYWGTRLKIREVEPEIITLTPPQNNSQGNGKKETDKAYSDAQGHSKGGGVQTTNASAPADDSGTKSRDSHGSSSNRNHAKGPTKSWNDQLLRTLKGKNGKLKKTAWRPGSGRHIDVGQNSYQPFTHIVRTLHLDDTFHVLANNRIPPKNLITFSSIESSILPNNHPCKDLKVLWFSAKPLAERDDVHNWYGNVEFAVNCDLLLEMFRNCFLVEIISTPTHTLSRILLTNKDYSSVLPWYQKELPGGSWRVTTEGHMTLMKCSRYKFRGTNLHDHVQEFMLEVTPQDEEKILANCEISFKNHEDAKDTHQPHVCNRHQRLHTQCVSPLSSRETAALFYQTLQQMNMDWDKVHSKLTEQSKQLLAEVKGNGEKILHS